MFSTEMKISQSDAVSDKDSHGKAALVDKKLIFFSIEQKLSVLTWHPAVFSSDMRKDTWVGQLWLIVFNLAISSIKEDFWQVFLVVCTSTSESGETSEQKRGSRKTLILCSRHCAQYLSQSCEESSTSPLKNTFWSSGSHSHLVKTSQIHIFKSFLETQRPNPTDMCDLRYAYISHVQKYLLAKTLFAFLVDKFQAYVLNMIFLFTLLMSSVPSLSWSKSLLIYQPALGFWDPLERCVGGRPLFRTIHPRRSGVPPTLQPSKRRPEPLLPPDLVLQF